MPKPRTRSGNARGLRLIDAIAGDLRYSLRQLRKCPVFTAAAVLTIAVGIGPNATMATIISSVFRPLPVGDAGRLAVLATTTSGNSRIGQRVALGVAGGAIAGVALARTLASVAATPGFPLFLDSRLDWATASYLAILMVASTLLIGLLPDSEASEARL